MIFYPDERFISSESEHDDEDIHSKKNEDKMWAIKLDPKDDDNNIYMRKIKIESNKAMSQKEKQLAMGELKSIYQLELSKFEKVVSEASEIDKTVVPITTLTEKFVQKQSL